MFSKFWILRKIERFEAGLDSVSLTNDDLTDLVRWQRNFVAFLKELYPNATDLVRAAEDALKTAGHDYSKASDPNAPIRPLDYKRKYRDAFQEISLELRSTIESHGLPESYRPPMKYQILVGLLLLLASNSATYFLSKSSSGERRQAQTEIDAKQAIVGVNDFHRWLKADDDHFRRSFDSASNAIAGRLGVESGMYLGELIRFGEEWRRQRDYSIDSMLVRLAQVGVAVDTLHFQRRLPIRVGTALKGAAMRMQLDAGVVNSVVMNDTL